MSGRIFVDDDDVGAQYFAFPEDESTQNIPSLNETIFEHISPNDLTTLIITAYLLLATGVCIFLACIIWKIQGESIELVLQQSKKHPFVEAESKKDR